MNTTISRFSTIKDHVGLNRRQGIRQAEHEDFIRCLTAWGYTLSDLVAEIEETVCNGNDNIVTTKSRYIGENLPREIRIAMKAIDDMETLLVMAHTWLTVVESIHDIVTRLNVVTPIIVNTVTPIKAKTPRTRTDMLFLEKRYQNEAKIRQSKSALRMSNRAIAVGKTVKRQTMAVGKSLTSSCL